MCGILGCVASSSSGTRASSLRLAVHQLFQLSESRGKEASGVAVRTEQGVWVHREARSARTMLRTNEFRQILDRFVEAATRPTTAANPTLIGHARLTTSGQQGINTNNQPVVCGQTVGVHNGIIVNARDLWDKHAELEHAYEVDTEILFRLIEHSVKEERQSLQQATVAAFGEIDGAASIAMLSSDDDRLLLATNTGSLYVLDALASHNLLFFASERAILREFRDAFRTRLPLQAYEPQQLESNSAMLVDLKTLDTSLFEFDGVPNAEGKALIHHTPLAIHDTLRIEQETRGALRRCTRCILPETFPGIHFDEEGVCNFCRDHRPLERRGHDELMNAVAPHRRADGQADCLVAFSGGRDSSYMLHYVKRELGLNPIAYTYDWGMVNDLARRNQSRVTSQLGVEQIIVSADIKRKRKHIGKNVHAWLRRPELGMVPLFMAGDKQFFYYANKLRKQTGIQLFIWGENQLERTNFKAGFCGIDSPNTKRRIYGLSWVNKARLLAYYVLQYLRNPAYINGSIWDTLFAYVSFYLIQHDYLWFYEYIPWSEDVINRLLINEYDWETDPETTTTWRIGDETAAFYNYIYWAIAGFSEIDTFRSNQIREGLISREEALRCSEEENQPRYDGIRNYLGLINVDFDEAMAAINSAKRLFESNGTH